MEIFKNKFLVKLIASICVFLTLLNFAGTTKVYADDQVFGGVLLKPVTKLLTSIGDGIMDLLQKAIYNRETSLIKISGDETWWAIAKTILAAVLILAAAVLFVVAVSATAGLANAALAVLAGEAFSFSMASIGGGTLLGGAVIGYMVGVRIGNDWFPDDIYLPVFTVSAEEIFANEIALFDINFFTPMDPTEIETGTQLQETIYEKMIIYYDHDDGTDTMWENGMDNMDVLIGLNERVVTDDYYEYDCLVNDLCGMYYTDVFSVNQMLGKLSGHINQEKTTNTLTNILNRIDTVLESKGYGKIDRDQENSTYVSKSQISYEGSTYNTGKISIIHGETPETGDSKDIIILFMQVNTQEEVSITKTQYSTAYQLRDTVSTWYFILRNIALLVLMLVLIYTGIRIVIGSTAGEKAKYKERLMDWLVAVCLVMIMHYIMVFAVNLVEEITDLIRGINNKSTNAAYIPLSKNQWNNAKELDWAEFGVVGEGNDIEKNFNGDGVNGVFKKDGDEYSLVWQTNLIGLFRLQSQLENEGTAKWIGYSFCYIVLVLYVLFFAFTYVKRVLYMAFLTMISPLVAMTYPIDKITDGKAQAFDMWLKEYIFNLMIQPLHLLLYTILVTSAFNLASTNPIYALVAIGFMMPAEKLMRKFFGFEKAKTPGLLGGAAGAALTMTGMQKLLGHKTHGGKGDGGNGNSKSKDQNKVKFANKNGIDAMESIAGEAPSGAQTAGGNPTSNSAQNSHEGQNGQQQTGGENTNQSYDSRLTPDQIDEMMAEGIGPGDQEYDQMLRQYGIDPTDSDNDAEDDNGDSGSANNDSDQGIDDVFSGDTSGSSSEESTTSRNKHSIKGAVGAVALGLGKQAATGILKGVHPINFAGKLAAGTLAGAAGLAVGIASGDPNKVFQYTTAGAVAGTSFANALSNSKGIDTDDLKEDAEQAYYGEDYQKKLLEREREKFKRDTENLEYLRKTLKLKNTKEARQVMESTGARCYDNGITSIEDIATIHRLTTEGQNGNKPMSFNYAVAARNYATKRLPSDTDTMDADKIKKYKARWKKEFEDKGYKNAEKLSNDAWEAAIRFNKARSGLTKL